MLFPLFIRRVSCLLLLLCARVLSQEVAISPPETPAPDNKKADFFETHFHKPLGVETYKTLYFLPFLGDFKKPAGRQWVEAAFQLSFQKDIVKNVTFPSPLSFDFGIAFTQTAWWQFYAASNPIREINFNPEAYLRFRLPGSGGEKAVTFHHLKMAVSHISNGKDGSQSRSWNRIYLEFPMSIRHIIFAPKVWYSFRGFGADNDERAIISAMGFCDLTVTGYWGRHQLRLYGRSNFNPKNLRGAFSADYSYPLFNTGLYIYASYFFGYGESLIDSLRPVNKLGIGLSLSR